MFYFRSEYFKIVDGDGLIVFYRYGYSSSSWKTFVEVKYGNGKNVTVEIYLTNRWSRFKLQYGIVRNGLQSGEDFFLLCMVTSTFLLQIINNKLHKKVIRLPQLDCQRQLPVHSRHVRQNPGQSLVCSRLVKRVPHLHFDAFLFIRLQYFNQNVPFLTNF